MSADVGGTAAPISFNRAGPFYRLQLRLGLLTPTDLRAGPRALLFVAIAWLPGLLFAAIEGLAWNEAHHERAMLLDFSVYAFAITIAAFVLMEQSSDRRMSTLVGQFVARGIVRDNARAGFERARENMERRTGSWLAELVILVASYALAYAWMSQGAARVEGGVWFGQVRAGVFAPSLVGWWMLLVALPLYGLLLGRWLWRFVTWGLLLRDVARCDLLLVATHPDRCGGLAFIGQYPKTYVLFVFAESTVVAATVLKLIVFSGASLMSFKSALLGMIVFFAIAFVLPLCVFAPVLVKLKRQGLARYGALASRHNLAFEAKWMGNAQGEPGAALLGAPDPSSLADLAAGYDLVKNMLAVPVTKQSIAPLVLAALAPLAAVAATQMPFKEIVAGLRGLLLF